MINLAKLKDRKGFHLNFVIDVPPSITSFTQILQNSLKIPFDFELRNIIVKSETNNLVKFVFTINGQLFPCQTFILGGINEVCTVATVADVAGSLNSTFFTFQTISILGVTTNYYCWYNIGGAGVDPAVAGATGVPVALAANATADQVAAGTQVAIDALANVTATVLANLVTITNDYVGNVINTADGVAATGFTFITTIEGITYNLTERSQLNTDLIPYYVVNTDVFKYPLNLVLEKGWIIEFFVLNTHTVKQKLYILFEGYKLFYCAAGEEYIEPEFKKD